jgi:hypothetical protein
VDDFVIARNPDEDSRLPFLVSLPLTEAGIVLKVHDTWPRAAKVYCHPSADWPDAPEVVERVPVRSCVRRGAAIDLVLDRRRENRSQFVFTRARGREVIFWQSARTARQARPNVSVPTQRASGQVLEILVDSHERYAWKFTQHGPEYTAEANLDRLRQRGLGHKRSLTQREFALDIEALERFARGEPLYRVHECVFGVLALESEPVDPRL